MDKKKVKTAEELKQETLGTTPAQQAPAVEQPKTTMVENPYAVKQSVAPDSATQYKNAQAVGDALNKFTATKPGAYDNGFQTQLDNITQQIMNGQKFEFDMNNDALYQQYRDVYQKNAQKAMEDTMGQAAMLTGGYGNSYAATAGNQAYHNQMDKLNAVALDIYDRRYNEHRDKLGDLYNQAGLLMQQDDTAYGRYRDDVSDWQDERDSLYAQWVDAVTRGDTMAASEYKKEMDALAQKNYEDEMAYQKERDRVSDAQWQKTFDRNVYESDRAFEHDTQVADLNSKISDYEAQLSDLNDKYYAAYIANSDNVANFKDSIMSEEDMMRSRSRSMLINGEKRNSYTYDEYVNEVIKQWYEDDKLDEDEVAYLKGYYGLN